MSGLFSHYLRQKRFQAVAPFLQGDVLDLGCGFAEILPWLKPGQAYVGVESHPVIIDWLALNQPGYSFYQQDLDFEDLHVPGKYDTILMIAVIEHLENPQRVLQQVPAYLKPGGRLVVTTPTPLGDMIHGIGARVGLFSKFAVDEHETIFTRETLTPLLAACRLKVQVYRHFLLGGNQLAVCTALDGQGT